MPIKHAFTNPKSDGGDSTIVRPSDWNANHTTGAFSTYTPTWTAVTTNPTLGNGTLSGRYLIIDKLCWFTINLLPGSTTTAGSGQYHFALPATAKTTGGLYQIVPAYYFDAGVAHDRGVAIIYAGGTVLQDILLTDSTGVPWGSSAGPSISNTDRFVCAGCIEID